MRPRPFGLAQDRLRVPSITSSKKSLTEECGRCTYNVGTDDMEFDWSDPPFSGKNSPTTREIEESFEDPLGVRLFPDSGRFAKESRAFCLGRTLTGRGIFSVYRSDGKQVRVIGSRSMTEEEEYFYDRKVSEWTS